MGYLSFKSGSSADSSSVCRSKPHTAVKVCGLSAHTSLHIPHITMDAEHPDHFKTFKQLCAAETYDSLHQHSTASQHGFCLKCRYMFMSNADQARHSLLVHGGNRKNKNAENANGQKYTMVWRNFEFRWKCCTDFFLTVDMS